MSLELLVIAGPDKGRAFVLNVGPDLMLGRDPRAHYQLSDRDRHVSRNHCQVLLEGGEVTIVCNQGSGGTFVNGQKIQRQILKPGDVVKVGNTELRLHLGGEGGLDVARE